jgi:polar amino acid transport system substrate-binding protein
MKKYILVLLTIMIGLLTGCQEKNGAITILTSSGYEPYEMVDEDGNLTGFDIELMETIAIEAGLEIEWKDVAFDGIIASLQTNQAQIAIAGITPTKERSEVVDFSDVYYNSESGLLNYLLIDTGQNINTMNELEGMIIGAQLGTIQAELLTTVADTYGFTVELRNTNTQIVEEMKTNRINAILVESLVADSIIENNSSLQKVLFESDLDMLYGNAIAFAKGSEYKEIINSALANLIEDGTIDDLISKWFQ